ncbi:hypothetical protein GO986_09180 [Deinococcus sp. HMF7620]|uniref:Uncharacterized protein n=1 Tax=Deinococcus arboris TaxID=2682977 RepID=A0A7C9LLX5_9DEIO|nr:hypothetical protein [Deinococcus arboris]MVN86937.1 hypothetical protein [Deinococcus arboris]
MSAQKSPSHTHQRLSTMIHRADREGGIDQVTPPCPPLAPLVQTAYQHGYALAVHGSLHRDMDLIAVAWMEKATTPEELVDALCIEHGLWWAGDVQPKPHGRIGVILQSERWLKPIDLSIIPPGNRPQ